MKHRPPRKRHEALPAASNTNRRTRGHENTIRRTSGNDTPAAVSAVRPIARGRRNAARQTSLATPRPGFGRMHDGDIHSRG
jgi:hypothetical protein